MGATPRVLYNSLQTREIVGTSEKNENRKRKHGSFVTLSNNTETSHKRSWMIE